MIASAEIFSPDSTCGSTRALTSGRAARAIGGEPMVWLIRLALTPPAPARASSWLATIFMNWSAGDPAIFLGESEPQQADLGRLAIERAGKFAGLVPFMGKGLDLLLDKAAHHVAEGVMLGGIERALHRIVASGEFVLSTMAGTLPLTCAEWLTGGTAPRGQA